MEKHVFINILFLISLVNINSYAYESILKNKIYEIDKVSPDFSYSLDIEGRNPRIYEFTPKSNSKISCVVIENYVENSDPSISCFNKEDLIKGRK